MFALSRQLVFAAAVPLSLLAACAPDTPTASGTDRARLPALDRASYDTPGMHRQYGTPQKLGEGMVRTYVVLDANGGQTPVELGVALDERALDGLPTHAGDHAHSILLQLPERSPAPYRFVEMNWNSHGHRPPGVYTFPHFDFHFYMTSLEARAAIDPSDAEYAAKANNTPAGAFMPPFYRLLGANGAAVAVAQMGVHWFDSRSPELQNLFGNPDAYQPFTKTFMYGTWDGRITFVEPMVARAFLLTRPNVTTAIAVPTQYPQPGWYPTSYRVSHDAAAKKYLVALTGLVAHP